MSEIVKNVKCQKTKNQSFFAQKEFKKRLKDFP